MATTVTYQWDDVPVPYSIATNQQQKKPVYYVVFGPIFNYTGSNKAASQSLPQQFATGPIMDATMQRPNWLLIPQSSSNVINLLTGSSSISTNNFQIQDQDGSITVMVVNYPMKNRLVTVYGGYTDIPESAFVPLFNGIIQGVTMNDGLTYTFQLKDFLQVFKTNVFGLQATLLNAITGDDSTITVNDANGFMGSNGTGPTGGQGSAWSPAYPNVVGYIQIDDEYIFYNGVSQNADQTWSFTGCQRGQTVGSYNGVLPGQSAPHDAGASVTEVVFLQGNPFTIFLWVLMSTGNNTNWSGTGTNYDVLTADQGAAMPYQYVDVEGIEYQRDTYVADDVFQFVWDEATDALTFCQDNICKCESAYPVVQTDGTLSIKVETLVNSPIGVPTIDDSVLVGNAQFQGNYQSQQVFFNEVITYYDYDPQFDQFNSIQYYEQTTSQELYAESSTISINMSGVISGYNGAGISTRLKNIIFSRFSQPPPQFTVNLFYTFHPVNVGDLVLFTSQSAPNFLTGQRSGPPQLYEVINRQVNWAQGVVQLTLLLTSLVYIPGTQIQGKPCIISPDGFPTYDSATTQQRMYGFISDNTLPVGIMPNGDSGYLITP